MVTTMSADTTRHSLNGLAHNIKGPNRANGGIGRVSAGSHTGSNRSTYLILELCAYRRWCCPANRASHSSKRWPQEPSLCYSNPRTSSIRSAISQHHRHVRRTQPDSGASLGQYQTRALGLYPMTSISYPIFTHNASFFRFRQTLPSTSTSCHSE